MSVVVVTKSGKICLNILKYDKVSFLLGGAILFEGVYYCQNVKYTIKRVFKGYLNIHYMTGVPSSHVP